MRVSPIRALAVPTVLIAAAVLACSDPAGPGPDNLIDELPRALTADEQSVISRSNGFGLHLLAEVAAADDRSNIVLSPLSASMALGMTMNGAADSTFAAMRSTLGFEGLDQESINDVYRDLIALLVSIDPDVRFEIANAIWANQNLTFHQAFFDAVTAAFDARVESADFSAAATLEAINAWVDEKTSGKIEKILESLDPDQVMLLLNAMYFDAPWTTEFDRDETEPGPFRRPDGTTVTVDMMNMADGEFRLGGGNGFSVAELPYGGGAFTMVLLVPDNGDARALAASLDDATWDAAMASLAPREVDLLSIPKLRLSYDVLLNDALSNLGMEVAFTPAADFSNMSPEGGSFCIDFVRQKTFLEVDEAGTRAAAVTVVGVGPTSFIGLVADRPFLFAVRERLSGTILFAGLIEDPTATPIDPEPAPSRCG